MARSKTRLGSSSFRTSIDLSGPFFEKDADKTFNENVRVMLEAMAAEGQADVRGQFAGHIKTDHGRLGVIGRVDSLTGKPWLATMIVSQQHVYPWKHMGARGFTGRAEAQYRGGKLEAQVHMFRKTASRLRRSRAVNMAELTKGLE